MANEKRHPIATWRVTLNGRDLTDIMRPRLIGLSLTEKRGEEADELEIVLDDKDGQLEIPSSGRTLTVELGWKQGANLPLGLISKGTFKVDEASWRGNPDTITIRARSADLTDGFAIRRERSFVDATVGDIIGAIAADNGLTSHINSDLTGKPFPALGTGARSDAARLNELGRRFGGVAMGKLIFAPISKGQTAGAKPSRPRRFPAIKPQAHRNIRGRNATPITAWRPAITTPLRVRKRPWCPVAATATVSPSASKKTYASETSARQAAEAEHKRVARSKATTSISLALGRPDITPERPIT
ncbi:phage late control D family protein [Asticcacaulis sp. ZE23SCel15]|uniref:phage late control D family protein n=1 Tax=Asticcacaulis sp. ZE23SCel15 TaxID=3059027 RepID=UPI00265F019B|nr:phage late control D family protein [Asticcacaulis sp. ZE23SCel15]WKL55997.1 phage late control D family protein [Asticcacaulis sp. ZE23SCel15]